MSSKQNQMFTRVELDGDCIVSSSRGMQPNKLRALAMSDGALARMARVDRTWLGRNVSVAHFPDSTKEVNATATLVAGREVRGNAVIIGVTAEHILTEQNKPKSWASLASAFPKTLEINDRIRARQARDMAERHEVWRDYHRRKQERNRRVNMDTATVNLQTGDVIADMSAADQEAADLADAAFAMWQVEDSESTMRWSDDEN